ncbi:MAG TPA: MFS transporter [Syntrophorhabdus sp.]|jgi:MFS family permease|nr:MFS transporter [Syntrophorhabdus sp.]OPX96882.1 MAG: Galactose-proton symporter [Syntrophorhabdus sp. PtaB.Bin027]OQB75749.1 MAG: Galactose-proton symporter [Deltaproteobacteria bacterium ADurb.Bin135]HNQ46251.1 MFS transporter [Syntrophorhabdus sp.]HOD78455.1 MFS transporter [Syntrophorhabdus sp.]
MNKERLWTKDFIVVSTTNFLIYLVFFLLMVIMASYAVDKYHATTGTGGLVSGIFIIGILIGRLGTGRIIEDVGSRRVLVIGTLLYIITSTLYFAAINLPLLILMRFLHGFAFGVANTATGTIAAQIIPRGRHGEGIGYYSMSQILATALGPYLGIVLSQRVDFKMIFLIASLVAAISFAISFVVSQPSYKPPKQVKTKTVKQFQISEFLEFRAIPISIIVLIVGFGYSVVLSFLSLYSRQLCLEEAASFFFLIYAIVVIFSRPFSGRLLDARGANFVVYPCILFFSIGMLVLSQATYGITLLLSGAIIGLGYGNFLSCGQAISVKSTSPNRFGLATATYYMFLDIGFGVGPYLFGSLVPVTGYRGLYFVMAMVILSTTLLYYFLYRKSLHFSR